MGNQSFITYKILLKYIKILKNTLFIQICTEIDMTVIVLVVAIFGYAYRKK